MTLATRRLIEYICSDSVTDTVSENNRFLRFFVSREVAIAFTLLLILPALTYFAMSAPVWLLNQFFPGIDSALLVWLLTLVILYVEAVGVATLHRTLRERDGVSRQRNRDVSTGQ